MSDKVFVDVRFYVTGEVDQKIIDLLIENGAEQINYFSDYVTHLICGQNPNQNDIDGARDLYEVPIIDPLWIKACLHRNRIVDRAGFSVCKDSLFDNCVFAFDQLLERDRATLWSIVRYYGGRVTSLVENANYLVLGDSCGSVYDSFIKVDASNQMVIVTPDWLLECVKEKTIISPKQYHPRYLIKIIPKPVQEIITEVKTQTPTPNSAVEQVVQEISNRLKMQQIQLKSQCQSPQPQSQSPQLTQQQVQLPHKVQAQSPQMPQQQVLEQQQMLKRQYLLQSQQKLLLNQNGQPVTNIQLVQQTPKFQFRGSIQNLSVEQQNALRKQLLQQQQIAYLQQQQMAQQQLQLPKSTQSSGQVHVQNQQVQVQQQQHQQQFKQLTLQHLAKLQEQQQLQQQILLNQQAQQQQTQQQIQKMNIHYVMQSNQTPVQQQVSVGDSLPQQQQQQQPQHVQPTQVVTQMQFQQQQISPQQQATQQHFVGPQKIAFISNQLSPQYLQNLRVQNIQFQPNQQWNTAVQQQQQSIGQQVPQQQAQQQQQQQQVTWNQAPQRHYIQLDAKTHAQLQQMDPQQRALFLQRVQRQRQLLLQQQQQQQQQQRFVIRSSNQMPAGLNAQQQVQWLQQQGVRPQTIVLQQTIPVSMAGQQQMLQQGQITQAQIQQPQQHIQQGQQIQQPQIYQDQQLQRQQQLQRLHQLQLQREQAQKQQQLQQKMSTVAVQQQMARSPTGSVQSQMQPQQQTQTTQVVVNAKTKTALANMLSVRLQNVTGSPTSSIRTDVGGATVVEPSAAGALRLMTAQHNASLNSGVVSPRSSVLALQQQRRAAATAAFVAATGHGGNDGMKHGAGQSFVHQNSVLVNDPKKIIAAAAGTGPNRILVQRPPLFYGHNPNLKLPPDLFLLGCVFFIIEYDEELKRFTQLKFIIRKYGGEVEEIYSPKVTHVICRTQRHGTVMQALRESKRAVTLHWFDDIFRRKVVLPPWKALHFPSMFMDGLPAKHMIISLSGFKSRDRDKVVFMINEVGAKFTKYFTHFNSALICAKADGEKYQRARKWNIPVVNLQWLTDLLLGNTMVLNNMHLSKYQSFNTVSFNVDYSVIPLSLMYGWKMPINISQEAYEKYKRSISMANSSSNLNSGNNVIPEPSPKKIKLDSDPDTDSIQQDVFVYRYRIIFSLIGEADIIKYKNNINQLGGIVVEDYRQATHLVMSKLNRSFKMIYGLLTKKFILPEKWLQKSIENSQFVPEIEYIFDDIHVFNKSYQCNFYDLLNRPQSLHNILANKQFFITPSVQPSRKQVQELIELSGGTVERIRRNLRQLECFPEHHRNYTIIADMADILLIYDLMRNNKNDQLKYVCSAELIYDVLLGLEFQRDKYVLSNIGDDLDIYL